MSTVFPKWTNQLPTILLGGVLGGVATVIGIVWYYFTPEYWEVGYMPKQPGTGFSHQIHVTRLGMDCRYCHTNVEVSSEANIPSVSTCMNCHADGRLNTEVEQVIGPRVAFIREAYEEDRSIPWRRVHKLPDYVRNFPHDVHVAAGVSCFSCHGLVAQMPVVHQVASLSMAWCLDCHRNPEPHLVPRDKVTDLFWVAEQFQSPEKRAQDGAALRAALEEKPLHLLPDNCGACHY